MTDGYVLVDRSGDYTTITLNQPERRTALSLDPLPNFIPPRVETSPAKPRTDFPLVLLTGRRAVMGVHVNRPLTTAVAWTCAVVISALNVFLLYQQFT